MNEGKLSTYLRIPGIAGDKDAAADEPEDQLLMVFVPRAMENRGAQLDAELDVLSVPENLPPGLVG